MNNIYTYESFDDRYNVIPSPTGETTITENGSEINIISLERIDDAIAYEDENPNTVWSVIRNENDDTDDVDEDSEDTDYIDYDESEDDYDPEEVAVQFDLDEDMDVLETYSIVPGIEQINVLFYLVTEHPYDDNEVLHQKIEFDI